MENSNTNGKKKVDMSSILLKIQAWIDKRLKDEEKDKKELKILNSHIPLRYRVISRITNIILAIFVISLVTLSAESIITYVIWVGLLIVWSVLRSSYWIIRAMYDIKLSDAGVYLNVDKEDESK